MPLLGKEPLQLHAVAKSLDQSELVYCCEETNEVFEDYEAFSSRTMSCNSLLWTCAITGKTNLTYAEALESENNALSKLDFFLPELTIPILYLANISVRTTLNELDNDIFNFIKERYFIGESLKVNFEADNWVTGKVIRVIQPTTDEIIEFCTRNSINHPIHSRPYPGKLYKYEVEEEKNQDDGNTKRDILSFSHIRRDPKGLYSYNKKKSRSFLLQTTEEKENKQWGVKESILNAYRIKSVHYKDIFAGEIPIFHATNAVSVNLQRDSLKEFNNKTTDKKSKKVQLKLTKFLKTEQNQGASTVVNGIVKKSKKKEVVVKTLEDKEKERELKLEQERIKKQERRKEEKKLADFVKEWRRAREDLECDDLKVLPEPYVVDCLIPNELFGDAVMVLEFLTSFKRNFLPTKPIAISFSFDTLQAALMEEEIAGPFYDILKYLLTIIYAFKEKDLECINAVSKKVNGVKFDGPEVKSVTCWQAALKKANYFSEWSRTHQGMLFSELPVNAISITEILRLHLLASGCKQEKTGTLKIRWNDRGGFTDSDDPGVAFCMNEQPILNFLSKHSAVTLQPKDKLKVLHCLINQILTYSKLRGSMEQTYERTKTMIMELKLDQIEEQKIAKSIPKPRNNQKKTIVPPLDSEEQKKLMFQLEKLKLRNEQNSFNAHMQSARYQLKPLGQDRGYRRYWLFSSLPGLFIEDNEQWPGDCLKEPTPVPRQRPNPADDEDTMTYIRTLYEACRQSTGSDKENTSLTKTEIEIDTPKISDENEQSQTLRCTADYKTCCVHNKANGKQSKWYFFYDEVDIMELINSLNKRGIRESELRTQLSSMTSMLIKHVSKCPIQQINRFVPTEKCPNTQLINPFVRYRAPNLDYPEGTPVSEIIEKELLSELLKFEEDLSQGALGVLPNRDQWVEKLTKGLHQEINQSYNVTEISEPTPESETESNVSNEQEPMESHTDVDPMVSSFAIALAQMARSIHPNCLKRPITHDITSTDDKIKNSVFDFWEKSLLRATSLIQVHLHLTNLSKSIDWKKSILTLRCNICKKKDNVEFKVTCDECESTYHTFCMRPKLSTVPSEKWLCRKCSPPSYKVEEPPTKKPKLNLRTKLS